MWSSKLKTEACTARRYGRSLTMLLRRALQLMSWRVKGREGVIIVKTTQAILIAHYPEAGQPGAAANTVEQLADYLVGVGY